MENLNIFNLYQKANLDKVEDFHKKLNSTLHVKTNYDSIECNFEWLDMMEDTIRYLDNILRSPNRFIVNEEEIVKVELARRITVDSIKHLSRNTNFIQDYDKKTGDVKPSKILNINKDESYNTYENRFIYTLISNMKNFIDLKKRSLKTASCMSSTKNLDYRAATVLGSEKVNVNINVDSQIHEKKETGMKDGRNIQERIARLELQIGDLCSSEVYQMLHKAHVALVMSPIKKTNVILKNVNFQYAVKLWNYLQEHIKDDNKQEKSNQDYMDQGELKKYIDDCCLLNYLTIDLLGHNEIVETVHPEAVEEITNQLIETIVNLNANMSKETLEQMIGEKIIITKQKNIEIIRQIQKVFDKHMTSYLDKISKLEI